MSTHIFCPEQHAACATPSSCLQTCKAYDDISAEARQVRLDLDKLIKARKLSLKSEFEIEHTRVSHSFTPLGWCLTIFSVVMLVILAVRNA